MGNPFLAIAQQFQQRAFTSAPAPAAPPVEVQAGWGTFPGHAPVVTSRIPAAPVHARTNLGANLGAMNLGQCRCPGAK